MKELIEQLIKELEDDIDACRFDGGYYGNNWEDVSDALKTLEKLKALVNER